MAYYNPNGLDNVATTSGWVHVFAADDSKVSKTPSKKAKPRAENHPINNGLGEICKIQSTPGNYVLASLADNELLAVYHPEGAGGMCSEDLTHGFAKFTFDGPLVDFYGSPTNVICMIQVEDGNKKPAGRTLFAGGGPGKEKEGPKVQGQVGKFAKTLAKVNLDWPKSKK